MSAIENIGWDVLALINDNHDDDDVAAYVPIPGDEVNMRYTRSGVGLVISCDRETKTCGVLWSIRPWDEISSITTRSITTRSRKLNVKWTSSAAPDVTGDMCSFFSTEVKKATCD
jgi:hypothetical protein